VQPGRLTDGTYILSPDMAAIQAAVQGLVSEQTAPTPASD
jgi:hypothetical protein